MAGGLGTRLPRPLVLVFEEIDALHGASLLSVLRQLRAGYPSRPDAFASSVILCGLRDVRDYEWRPVATPAAWAPAAPSTSRSSPSSWATSHPGGEGGGEDEGPPSGPIVGWQREALELKVWAEGRPGPLDKGLVQLDAYLAGLGLNSGVLVLFDRRPGVPPAEERTCLESATTAAGRAVTVLRA